MITMQEIFKTSNSQLNKLHKKEIIAAIKGVKSMYDTAKFDISDMDSMGVKLAEALDSLEECVSVSNGQGELIQDKNVIIDTLNNICREKDEEIKKLKLSLSSKQKCNLWKILKIW